MARLPWKDLWFGLSVQPGRKNIRSHNTLLLLDNAERALLLVMRDDLFKYYVWGLSSLVFWINEDNFLKSYQIRHFIWMRTGSFHSLSLQCPKSLSDMEAVNLTGPEQKQISHKSLNYCLFNCYYYWIPLH